MKPQSVGKKVFSLQRDATKRKKMERFVGKSYVNIPATVRTTGFGESTSVGRASRRSLASAAAARRVARI
jgi:hypothetical protein